MPAACHHTFHELNAALGALRRGLAAVEQELRTEQAARPSSSDGDAVSGTAAAASGASAGGGSSGDGSGSAYLQQLEQLRARTASLLQRAEEMLRSARSSCSAAAAFLGEGAIRLEPSSGSAAGAADREALAREPKRMLGHLNEFLTLMQKAHADSARMAVCLASLRGPEDGVAVEGGGGDGAGSSPGSAAAAADQAAP